MTFAKCPRCRHEMAVNGSCWTDRYAHRWGEDQDWMTIEWPCHDCNVAPGSWHHAGCLLRISVKTGEQL